MGKKSYKIERRMIDISKWYQRSNLVPMWCLIECSTRWFYINGGASVDADPVDYEKILMINEDYDTIKKEFDYFNGEIP